MTKKRDYKAEYQRRIANAEKRGLSRPQARGHPRPGEKGIRPTAPKNPERLEAAYKTLRDIGSQKAAAKAHDVSVDRLRRYVREKDLAKWDGREWQFTDTRPREMQVISDGEVLFLTLDGFEQASLNGRHLAAVKDFISNDIAVLEPFIAQSVTDANGKRHPLETDPNTLHRLAAAGTEVFHEIYRLVL